MFKERLLQHYRLSSFICGWISVLALPPFHIFPTLFLSFPVLLWLITKAPNKIKAFKTGYYFGFSFFAFGLSWINNALLIDANTFGWLIPIAFLASGLFFGLFIAIPSWLTKYFKSPISQYLGFSAFMVLSEWIRSFFLTGFPWNLFGTTLAFNLQLIQTAAIGGTYLLSLAVIMACSAPFFALLNSNRKDIFISLLIPTLIFSSLYVYGIFHIKQHQLQASETTIRFVQPAIPQSLKWSQSYLEDNLYEHIKMSQLPGADKIDFIIWSETAFPFSIEYDEYHRQMLSYALMPQTTLITGGIRYQPINNEQHNMYNSMFVIDSANKIVATYDKSHLVPFGEYIPFRQYLPEWLKPIASQIGSFSSGISKQPVKISSHPSFGGLICYEIIFPHNILNQKNKPDWIINITNDGWYGISSGPFQHLVSAQMRAVEEGITIARSAGSGISALISPLGEIIGKIPLGKRDILDIKLPKPSKIFTYYGLYGNIIPILLCSVILAIAILINIKSTH